MEAKIGAERRYADLNKVERAFARMDEQIKMKVEAGLKTPEDVAKTGRCLDMDFEEWFKFQELKSLAQIHDKLTVEEALTIYHILGSTVMDFNGQPVHVKAVMTQIFKELLSWKIKL